MKNTKTNRNLKLTTVAAVAALAGVLIISTAAFAQGPDNGIHTPGAGLSGTELSAGPQGGRYGQAARLADGTVTMNQGFGRSEAFVDADGDGVCDNLGTGQRLGDSFVDADGDGVCDNLGTGMGGGMRGGAGGGRNAGRGAGGNAGRGSQMGGRFIDANGNGVCDNLPVAE